MTAREALEYAMRDALDRGLIVPCLGRLEWTSDDAQERAQAASECDGCPCLTACSEAAREGEEDWGTWAGVDRSPAKRSAGRPRKEPAA